MSTVFMMFEAAEHNVSSDSVSLILKGRLEGGNYDFKDLYYLSPHTLDSAAGLAYANPESPATSWTNG